MSKDLSSNLESPNKISSQNELLIRIVKSLVLVSGTIGLFFIGQVIGVFMIYGVLNILGQSNQQIESLISDNPAIQFLAVLLIEVVTIGLLWWAHSLRKQKFFSLVGLQKRPKLFHLGVAILTYCIYFVTLLVVVAIANTLIPALDVDQAQQLGFENAKGGSLIFVFATLVILPPIAEEILFRGFLFKRLRGLITLYPAAIITSIIFALAHTEFLGDNPLNWIAALDTFILSLFLIYLLQKTKSLWPSIFLHAIKNSLAFIVLFIL